jgi:hypothetical protein
VQPQATSIINPAAGISVCATFISPPRLDAEPSC